LASRSKKSVQEILSSSREYISLDDKQKELDRKITLATEGFTTNKYCELVLRDRTRLSAENALTLANYTIDYRREINASLRSIKTTIQVLSELSRDVGIEKKFADMTRDDILSCYLDRCRKSENDDPMHKWIGTYTIRRQIVLRFFKWLRWRDVSGGDPKARDKLCKDRKEPKCIQDIPWLKRKELSCYKPTDMWTVKDDLLFVKYVTNKRDRCYQMMSRDTSARPHELLALKIRDVTFKLTPDGKRQYAEVVLNGKTGSRPIPLIQSIPYVKAWLSDHPRKNVRNSYLFVSLSNQSSGNNHTRQLSREGLYGVYDDYKKAFFPKLLEDPAVPSKDKEKIKELLTKPWNPYVRRHSGATEKADMLNDIKLRQYGGWTPGSKQPQRYVNYFANESSETLLEVYGIATRDNSSVELLSPKTCPNCNEGNTTYARFCAKCKMILTYDAYEETLQRQQEKELQIQKLQEKHEQDMKDLKQQVEENKQQLEQRLERMYKRFTMGDWKGQSKERQRAFKAFIEG
jgi:integrase/recombinase XerD